METLISDLGNTLFSCRKEISSQKYKEMYDTISKIKIYHEAHLALTKKKDDIFNHMLVHIFNCYKLEKR